MKLKDYIFKRLQERSFWIGISLASASAAVLPYPWNAASFFAGLMGSLVPDGNITHDIK